MAHRIFTIVSESGTKVSAESTVELRTPMGMVVVSDLEVGDYICLCSDGTHAGKIESIEEVD